MKLKPGVKQGKPGNPDYLGPGMVNMQGQDAAGFLNPGAPGYYARIAQLHADRGGFPQLNITPGPVNQQGGFLGALMNPFASASFRGQPLFANRMMPDVKDDLVKQQRGFAGPAPMPTRKTGRRRSLLRLGA